MKSGVERIADERARQIAKEGWTPEHDDEHTDHSLALAAALYATPVALRGVTVNNDDSEGSGYISYADPWPWHDDWDKRPRFDDTDRLMEADDQGMTVRIRCLEKAGALIAAEIDRLQRIEPSGVERP